MDSLQEYRKKCILIGDTAVGKTSLIRRLVVDFFDDKYITTIGTKITVKDMHIAIDQELVHLKFQIWDILGQKGYTNLYHSSFKGAHGVIFVADITRMETFDSIETYWIPHVQEIIGDVPFIIMANKSDLIKGTDFNRKELKVFASKYKVPYFLTSAKNGENVNKGFNSLGTKMLQFKGSHAPKKKELIEEIENPVALLIDRIISDFCSEYGGLEDAMPILRRQFELANLDINNPTEESLISAVENLADVESGFKDKNIASANLKKRLKWIREN
jgi:small GTP-binding protein